MPLNDVKLLSSYILDEINIGFLNYETFIKQKIPIELSNKIVKTYIEDEQQQHKAIVSAIAKHYFTRSI